MLSSCGYRYTDHQEAPIRIDVPYATGDVEGQLTDALVYALASSGQFECVREGQGNWSLSAAIVSQSTQPTGYRYGTQGNGKDVTKHLYQVEGRSLLRLKIHLHNRTTGSDLLPPFTITTWLDYDSINEGSMKDLFVIDAEGKKEPILQFSQGQLDSVEGATSDLLATLYRKAAQKVIEAILSSDEIDLSEIDDDNEDEEE